MTTTDSISRAVRLVSAGERLQWADAEDLSQGLFAQCLVRCRNRGLTNPSEADLLDGIKPEKRMAYARTGANRLNARVVARRRGGGSVAFATAEVIECTRSKQAFDRVDNLDLIDALKKETATEPDAAFALMRLQEATTLQEWAERNGASIRTARRRYQHGLRVLAQACHRLTG